MTISRSLPRKFKKHMKRYKRNYVAKHNHNIEEYHLKIKENIVRM